MIKAIPEGFESMVIRNGEPVRKDRVTAFEEELLELAHEKLVEIIINEVTSIDTDELVSLLDDLLNDNNLDGVIQEGQKGHRFVH